MTTEARVGDQQELRAEIAGLAAHAMAAADPWAETVRAGLPARLTTSSCGTNPRACESPTSAPAGAAKRSSARAAARAGMQKDRFI